ncbi:hypothetical protein GGH13_005682 [Coemansia sp. S155-1]|nr:hypothetical protein H4S03_002216 [Coemansia sp. S3946]KAJ2066528.1 hypothetical protein GGH13_005682 [Coemansia sp. S155-1]
MTTDFQRRNIAKPSSILPPSDKYRGSSERRLPNQNEAAVMNFRRIVDSLCETGDIPQALKRSTPRPTSTAAGKRVATTGRKTLSKRSRNGTS